MQTLTLKLGDCVERMAEMPEASVDAIVCDPPYGLRFMESASKGVTWDNLGVGSQQREWHKLWLVQAYRVLKPGGLLLAFNGTRTHHHLSAAMEQTGFTDLKVREWSYGCLSEDTEILTQWGWKYRGDTQPGTFICTFDPATSAFDLQQATSKVEYLYEETAYRLHGEHTDQLVSKDHRVLIQEGEGWVFVRAQDLPPGPVVVPYCIEPNMGERFKALPCPVYVDPVPYKGIVWCVEVPTGAFVARRNGKVFITGNSGFPKSLNVGKNIDKALGAKRKKVSGGVGPAYQRSIGNTRPWMDDPDHQIDGPDPVTELAALWNGYGTSAKPAHEPIIQARKPVDSPSMK